MPRLSLSGSYFTDSGVRGGVPAGVSFRCAPYRDLTKAEHILQILVCVAVCLLVLVSGAPHTAA
jgi:hypothetical protein